MKENLMDISLIVNIFYFLYDLIRRGIWLLLKATLFSAEPELAKRHADAISMLIPITTIWIILELTSEFKKILRIIVIIGWGLLLLSIILSIL